MKRLRRVKRVAPDETVAPSGTTPSGLGALVFVFRGLRPRLFMLIPFGDRRRIPWRSGVMFPGRQASYSSAVRRHIPPRSLVSYSPKGNYVGSRG